MNDELVAKFGEKALGYINALEEIAKQYAPDVVDAALTVIRVNAAFELSVSVVMLAVLFFVGRWYFRNVGKWLNHDSEGVCIGAVLGGIAGVFGALFFGGVALINLMSFGYWIALFDPRLYIAYKALGKLL